MREPNTTEFTVLNHLRVGIVVLRGGGEVLFVNTFARQIVDELDGIQIQRARNGTSVEKLIFSDRTTQIVFDTEVRAILERGGQPGFIRSRAIRVSRPSGKPAVAARIAVLNETGGSQEPLHEARLFCFLTDPAKPPGLDEDWLQSAFGLTTAEVRTALVLAEGETLADTAGSLGVSVNTLKTQLHQLYTKIGVDTRAKLVRLMLMSCSPI